jgi:hypothetical protein
MKTPHLRSRYRKNQDLIDYDYLEKLSPSELAFMEAFTGSYYNGTPTSLPGSVGPKESHRLNGERRRGAFGAMQRVEGEVETVEEVPAYRSAFGEARKAYKRQMKKQKLRNAG